MYKLTQDGTREIVYDVFSHVLHLLKQDSKVKFADILLRCSLVSKEWAIFTIPLLYNSLDLRLGYAYYSFWRSVGEIFKVTEILRVLRSDSPYFPYWDFVHHITVPAGILVPFEIGGERNLENWITLLKSKNLEPLKLTNLRNLRSVEVTRCHPRESRFMSRDSYLVEISAILEALPYLEKLALFGFWLFQLPSCLKKFQCTTCLPPDISSFTECLKNLPSLEDLDLMFTDYTPEMSPRPPRTLDWRGFKVSSSSPSIRKFRLTITNAIDLPGYFNPRPLSILLRYVAECHKIRILSLQHVNVQLQDVVKLSSAMPYLQHLELSVPSTIGDRSESNGWEEFKSFLSGASEMREVYFLESVTLGFRFVRRGLRIRRTMKLDKVFTFDEAFQWSEEDFLKRASKIRRRWETRRGLCLSF